MHYWPAAVFAGDGAALRNIARGRPIVASAEQATAQAARAVDGDTTTTWGAGQFAPQWIEIDLGAPVAIAAIRLGVDRMPDGERCTPCSAGRPGRYRELHVFRGMRRQSELLEFVPQAPWEDVGYVRFDTRASPSWVAWREIEVFAGT